MNDIILSICIPTYNRSKFLDRALFYITNQLENIGSFLEIVVLDNDSDDNTFEVVQKYIHLSFPINYIKNDCNLGADFNVDKCYQVAKGRYVLTLGDDDILILNSIEKLINILNDSDYGVIHLTSKSIDSDVVYKLQKDYLDHKIYFNSNQFFDKIGYNITFISTNIVNKKYYNNINGLNFAGLNLPQVPYIIHSILRAKKNLIIEDCLIRAQVDNTGGYNLFKVFGNNLIKILFELSLEYPGTKFYKIITDKLLVYFFPFWIIKLKKDLNFKKSESPNTLLLPLFKRNIRFWIYCYPLEFMPYYFAIIFNFATLIPHRLNKYLLKLFDR